MALLNLTKIILHRSVQGVTCPACRGLLEAMPVPSGWFRKWIVKKERVCYRCPDCGRRYLLTQA
ncbi:MAG: hypothetical protein EOP52_05635 [Sphingobacteriales bacterium]|nr:MAG: hypothetical protein EOP52_05635 [Sphingobacteriales bacterium]